MYLHDKIDTIINVDLAKLQAQIDEHEELLLSIMEGLADMYTAESGEAVE